MTLVNSFWTTYEITRNSEFKPESSQQFGVYLFTVVNICVVICRVGQEPLAKQILRRKWGWIGHTLGNPAPSTTRQALTWNPQGKRKRGQLRNSWRRDAEAELKRQGTNWSGMARAAQSRVRWRGVVDGLCSTGSDGYK